MFSTDQIVTLLTMEVELHKREEVETPYCDQINWKYYADPVRPDIYYMDRYYFVHKVRSTVFIFLFFSLATIVLDFIMEGGHFFPTADKQLRLQFSIRAARQVPSLPPALQMLFSISLMSPLFYMGGRQFANLFHFLIRGYKKISQS